MSPIGGNADLGTGLTQTRAMRSGDAKDLQQNMRKNGNDIWLRIAGCAFPLGVIGAIFVGMHNGYSATSTVLVGLVGFLFAIALFFWLRTGLSKRQFRRDLEILRSETALSENSKENTE